MKRLIAAATTAACLSFASLASADTFEAGSLIIPMDLDYQDQGMLKAFGLVYELLRQGVPVRWVIKNGKAHGEVDFVASGADLQSGAPVSAHGYRGGPFVIAAADAAKAKPIIAAWQAKNAVVVHTTTAPFDGDVRRKLVVAPSIALFADGNQKIARGYLQAAGIPDSTLDPAWPDTGPDLLDPTEVAGPTATDHRDGKLFDADGDPTYCQFLSMHWAVTEAVANQEVVAEVREFLKNPVHFFGECQAVNAFENQPQGHFLTEAGYLIGTKPASVDYLNADLPFAQMDGAFVPVGGSEPAYSLPLGSKYKALDSVMITKAGTPVGDNDVWMTGYLDGTCPVEQRTCGTIGKISYLGGHQFTTATPLSKNPTTQGTRLFLNSLFEAPCAADAGQPTLTLVKKAPAFTSSSMLTFTLEYGNGGPGVAQNVVLSDAIPAGATFVSASAGGALSGGSVQWSLQNLGAGESGTVTFTVTIPASGTITNTAQLGYQVGLNKLSVSSNTTQTQIGPAGGDADGDGLPDAQEIALGTDPNSADSDGDGIGDFVETDGGAAVDTDGDGLIDALDTDSDGDGALDKTEGVVDSDGDGKPDYRDGDDDGDGIATSKELTDGAVFGQDVDGDGKPDYLDTDSDGDGKPDMVEGAGDADGDGVPNYLDPDDTDGPLGDPDGDGLTNAQEAAIGTNPKFADSDGDGLTDGAEAPGGSSPDSDGDGLIDPLDPDDDGDGIATSKELSDGASFGQDVDGDGKPNYLDTDSDGDGKGDMVEGTGDADGDGVPDYLDPDGGAVDSDGDGLPDAVEKAIGTDPNDADSDDDGVPDGAEPDFDKDTDGDGLINALDPDSDDDGLYDGTELGKGCDGAGTDATRKHCRPDADMGATTTDPLKADTDGGGARDGSEDVNLNGAIDPGETDPTAGHGADDASVVDSDGDGLSDGLEATLGSNPGDADSDDDGLADGEEHNPADDTDGDGVINVLDPDSDNDGLFDGTEAGKGCSAAGTDVAKKRCVPDGDMGATVTSAVSADTDRGGASDGSEDANLNGVVDGVETNPTAGHGDDDVPFVDTDGDGLSDAVEATIGTDPTKADSDGDGVVDGMEPNVADDTDGDGLINGLDPDSDNDGLFDGTEMGKDCSSAPGSATCIADADGGKTTTSPLLADTDHGGVSDGQEDTDKNGAVGPGERDPNDASDDGGTGAGGAGGAGGQGGAAAGQGGTGGQGGAAQGGATSAGAGGSSGSAGSGGAGASSGAGGAGKGGSSTAGSSGSAGKAGSAAGGASGKAGASGQAGSSGSSGQGGGAGAAGTTGGAGKTGAAGAGGAASSAGGAPSAGAEASGSTELEGGCACTAAGEARGPQGGLGLLLGAVGLCARGARRRRVAPSGGR